MDYNILKRLHNDLEMGINEEKINIKYLLTVLNNYFKTDLDFCPHCKGIIKDEHLNDLNMCLRCDSIINE